MSISREQFDALTAAYYGESIMDSATKKQLEESGYIKEDKPTEKGLSALEPFRVKSAVFLAAGLGSRLMPLTKDTPKPLIKVFGKSFIERLIEACLSAEIEKIYIVVGYLKEKFKPLKEKYSQIEFIENEKYDCSGTVYSVYRALDKFDNTYLLESDLLLYNPKLIKKYNYRSNALGIKIDKTDDWCWTVNSEGRITYCQPGGENCYLFEGVVYFDKQSCSVLKQAVREVVENIPEGEKKYLAQAVYTERLKDYYLEIRECSNKDIIEIDSFNELKEIDKSYDI
ncbi:MAG TPA: CTP--phosphocholine cytidylyltransferase [Ruminococcaceae bacterium]|nr:CTP--phosphocholine cytidylyltransferase [Oscillospiraceae bacterium]